jgi:2-phospho-L-lactate/phosphoenolpyruvate guanylyltransferase
MQATVRSFDATTHSGDVLFDDGTALSFDASAFDPSGLLLLRVGQRVRLRLDDAGEVVFVTLATFADGPDVGTD